MGRWAWLLAGRWLSPLGVRWPVGWWAQLLAVPLLLLLRADGSVGRWVFSERITRLSASKLFEQRPHSPGSQLRQGRPALAQEQLREEQVAPTAQKQQRSCRATSVFRRLLPPSLAGGAIVTDEE